eukprot:1140283-Pelagomonas_calceolata.AAC.2
MHAGCDGVECTVKGVDTTVTNSPSTQASTIPKNCLHESARCDDVCPCKAHIPAAACPLYRKTTGNIKNFILINSYETKPQFA